MTTLILYICLFLCIGVITLQAANVEKPSAPFTLFDKLIVGSGMGGQYAAYRLGNEFPGKGNVGLVTDDSRICGNIVDIDLQGTTPSKPLRFGGCAARINIATMPHMRCLANELRIPIYFSPWNSHFHFQGYDGYNWRWNYNSSFPPANRLQCAASLFTAAATCADYQLPTQIGYGTTAANLLLYPTSGSPPGSYPGLYNLSTWQSTSFYSDYSGDSEPVDDAWGWVFGYPGYYNPALAYNNADPLPYDSTRPTQNHPVWTCSQFADAYSLLSFYLGPDYAQLIRDTNVGFMGDYIKSNDACSYFATQYIQYNNLDEGYPVGGMTEFCRREMANATGNGVTYYYNEPVLSIDHATGKGYRYIVQTSRRAILANDIILNLGPDNIAKLKGDVAEKIQSHAQSQQPKSIETVTVTMQFNITTARWWDYVLTNIWGSYRRMAPGSCTNRLEMLKTPYHMYHHGIRAAYTDATCMDMWKTTMARGDSYVKAEIMRQLHEIFDQDLAAHNLSSIPDPVLVQAHYEDTAWWYMKPGTPYTWQQLTQWANTPAGNSERVCLAHSAWQIYYSGWSVSAINRTDECLHQLYPTHFQQSEIDTWKTCGHFIDDNTVGPLYSTPGLNTQYNYYNGLSNEFFPPYTMDQAVNWTVSLTTH